MTEPTKEQIKEIIELLENPDVRKAIIEIIIENYGEDGRIRDLIRHAR